VSIEAAERTLGFSFPPSFSWWLENYGGGQIGGDIVYGLDEQGIEAPDIVKRHEADTADGQPPNELVFYIGNEERFHMDVREPQPSGEYRIYYREAGQPDTLYARSFDEFLQKRITDILGA
jgi:hypothetical protein